MPVPAHAPDSRPEGEINTLLGRGSEFEGKLTFEGTVRIDGKLSGEIFSDDVLVIGEGAQVSAEIDVGVVIVEGNVNGNIRAKRAVELHAPARVRGNIETPSLYVDKGVIFEGNCKMENVTASRPAPPTGAPRSLTDLSSSAAQLPGGSPSAPPTPKK
jgi:cytoskeletal protein CcmA (bactofilin family)